MSKNVLTRSRKQKAMKALGNGQPAEAVRLLNEVCRTDPGDIDAWQQLSGIHGRMGNLQGVLECCQRLLALDPNNVMAHSHLGNVHTAAGRPAQAIAAYEKARQLDPNNPDIQTNLGALYFREGKTDSAIDVWQKVIQLRPNHVEALKNLSSAFLNRGRYKEIPELGKRILAIAPRDSDTCLVLGETYLKLGMPAESIQAYHKALQYAGNPPVRARIYCSLGAIAMLQGELEQALQYYESAIGEEPANRGALSGRANVYYRLGEKDKAHRQVRELLDAGKPSPELVMTYSHFCHHFGECDEVISYGEQFLATRLITDDQRQLLHFSLGQLLDRLGRYDDAFRHYQLGNRMVKVDYIRKEHEELTDRLIATYSQGSLKSLPRSSLRDERPVFIIGMPRSGTSLVEQILASHPRVHGAGELNELSDLAYRYIPNVLNRKEPYPQCAALMTPEQIAACTQKYLARIQRLSRDADRITDKMPQNFLHLGLIAQLFPGARIIHCLRDPLDTALSIYFQRFIERHSYAFDLENIGHYHIQYQRLMRHWKEVIDMPLLDVGYQELVSDFENTCRRMVAFLGLEWDDRCLQFHRSERRVATASHDQVRNPVYSSSLQRWKHYEQHLGPLIRVLRENETVSSAARAS